MARVVSSTSHLPREVTVTPLLARQMLYGFAATPHFPLHMQWFAISRLTSSPI